MSILLIGAMVGALGSGTLADWLGRKKTMALTAFLFIVGALITAASDAYTIVLLGRFITGIAVGTISLLSPLYLAEVSPAHFRGRFVSLYQLFITLGILGAFLVNYLFASSGDWRWMFLIGAFPAALQLILLFFIPETPSWLLKKGRADLAAKVFGRLRKDRKWQQQIEEMKTLEGPQKKGRWKDIFSSKYRFVLIIGLILSACQQITGINTVIYYAPVIFQNAGFSSVAGATLATLGIGVINVIATIISVSLLDRAGRRLFLLIGSAGMALSLIFLSFVFFQQSPSIDRLAVGSLMAYVAFFAIGLGPVTFVLISEIYPMKIRAKAMTVAIFVNWFANYWVSLTFLDLVNRFGQAGTFLLYAVISIATFLFVLRWVPETKNQTLEELERKLTGKR